MEPQKLTGYLLDPAHPVGGPKALFFEGVGFSRREPSGLKAALLSHPDSAVSITSEVTAYGRKFVVEGPLATPVGGVVFLRSVWFTEGKGVRLVTAYPR